jgi:cobalt-zinc-cadmium efflux system outer membrane protein
MKNMNMIMIMMKNNNIKKIGAVILLLSCVPYLKLMAGSTDTIVNNISFQTFLNSVGKNNLSYLAEKHNVDIAEAEVIASKVMPDPELSFEGAKDNYTLELGYALELGNKRGARVNLAKSQSELTKLALSNFFQELRAEAANAFLDAMMQRELLDVKKSSYEYMVQLSKSDSIRFKLGEITENDARQSKLEAATLLNEVYQQEADLKSALAVLNMYMGKSADVLEIPVGEWGNIERDYNLAELINIASYNRADLMMAAKNTDVVTNQLKLAQAERKMDLGLMVGYERDWNGFFPNRNSVKAGVSIPLKFSNTNKGAVKAAQFAIDQSKYEYRNVQLQIQTEVSQNFYQYDAAKKKVKQYQLGLLSDSKKILEGFVYSYRRGETSILDVLVAQRTYNEVQEQYLEAMKGYASALVDLEKSCGIWDIDF